MRESEEKKRALVTGAVRFVGAHLVRQLIKDGWNVHCIIRPSSKLSTLGSLTKKVTLHTHDGTTKMMLRIVKESEPTVVFHLASLFLAEHNCEDVTGLISSNVLFATQLVEAMVAQGVPYLINTGTAWQHFENQDYNPVCLYAATKQAFDDILRYYTETTPLKVVTLKLHDTYGPGDPRPKLIHLLSKVADTQEILAMSPGEQLVDMVYIDDVVEAYLIAEKQIKKISASTTYAVSSGHAIGLHELVQTFEGVIGKSLNIEWGGRPYRSREVMVPWNLGKCVPGWHPKISLAEGLRRTISENHPQMPGNYNDK